MELGHVFVCVHPDGPDLAHLAALGLIETYRRRHPGQGTTNACFCFDNLFLELLWVCDQAEIESAVVSRTGLAQRAHWAADATCPFGIAWRNESAGSPPSIATWDYRPPYLPAGMVIAVATDGDDPMQPMMFRSPGTTAPINWPLERRGQLQHPAGLGRVLSIDLAMPTHIVPSPALDRIAASTILRLSTRADQSYVMTLNVERLGSGAPLRISLPTKPGL